MHECADIRLETSSCTLLQSLSAPICPRSSEDNTITGARKAGRRAELNFDWCDASETR
ncbi:hypothetical protein PAXINDRAFT_165145 [Paxillus involutus ATCC 200175]|nr:hypothetical protein PAXINDRAFT_165145 [Paxillus involutus ATCC 200175]